MQLKRLFLKRCSKDVIIFCCFFCSALIVYCYRLKATVAQAGWKLPQANGNDFSVGALSWQARVHDNNNAASSHYGKYDAPLQAQTVAKFQAGQGQNADFETLGIVRNKNDKYVRDIGYKVHAFNALISNNIGLYRDVPDTRHKVCPREPYTSSEQLPTASIIMCFFNEHKMTLLRSIKSVLARTPATLLKEIILVDDASDLPELTFQLQLELHKNFADFKHLHYVRNEQRQGLIRARVLGAKQATGDVLIFLDSHIEVNQQWAEPLLRLVQRENSTLAVPVIDLISPDTFLYMPSPLVRGGFNWGLHYKWENLPAGTLNEEKDFEGPFKTPTMAGGLFAVNRQYFHHIGEYDMGMDIWGGENIEISFRTWQCGGAIKIVPCSRVGHIFRKRRPYSAPDGTNTMLKNSLRLAYVWMDEYKEHFLAHEKVAKDFDYGDIAGRLALRQKLQCKNFEWYLKHVYPELRLPGEEKPQPVAQIVPFQPWHSRKRNYTGIYLLRLSGTELCASVTSHKVKGFYKKGSKLTLQPCMGTKNQIWYETDKFEIILDRLLCLQADDASLFIGKCHEMLGDQQWRHTKSEQSPIYNMATGTCIHASSAHEQAALILDLCSKHERSSWDILQVPKSVK